MSQTRGEQWERARVEMLDRWGKILDRIEAHDEGGVLALANVMDEFCEAAIDERQAAAGNKTDPAVPILKFPWGATISGRCVFCRGFSELGGCFGVLHELNRAVLSRQWRTARRLAEEYLDRLRAMDLGSATREAEAH